MVGIYSITTAKFTTYHNQQLLSNVFLNLGQSRLLFNYFRSCLIPISPKVSISTIKIAKSIDGVLGIQTRGPRRI